MLYHDNNLQLINLSTLINCLLDDVWMLLGEVTCKSLLGVKGLKDHESKCKEQREIDF